MFRPSLISTLPFSAALFSAALFSAGLFSAACSSGTVDSSALAGGDTCTALTSDTWTVTGAAWGMGDIPMDGKVTMDAEACSFSFSGWDMQMDDLPTGGVLDGDSVQLDGLNSYWQSCTGTATDSNNAGGTCADDGDEWAMTTAG